MRTPSHVTPYSLVGGYQHFGRTCNLLLPLHALKILLAIYFWAFGSVPIYTVSHPVSSPWGLQITLMWVCLSVSYFISSIQSHILSFFVSMFFPHYFICVSSFFYFFALWRWNCLADWCIVPMKSLTLLSGAKRQESYAKRLSLLVTRAEADSHKTELNMICPEGCCNTSRFIW